MAVYISEDVQGPTLSTFIRETCERIEARAKSIAQGTTLKRPTAVSVCSQCAVITGKAVPSDRSDEEIARIQKESRRIVREGWSPKFWMIDKARAEKGAILEGKQIFACDQAAS